MTLLTDNTIDAHPQEQAGMPTQDGWRNTFYKPFDLENLVPQKKRQANKAEHRTRFQIDRDRIIFSYAFRRLQSKTQVFRSGEYDFYRTRLTHSIEVARIGRSICDYLKAKDPLLNNNFYIDPDLTEALGLAHDLGHPPFGHIGERKLNELMGPYGGFEGNAQTLRILTELIYERPDGATGMNPSRAFLDGVFKYKKLFGECVLTDEAGGKTYPDNHFIYDEQKYYRDFILAEQTIPEDLQKGEALNKLKSIECQIMDWADDSAYCLHDILDGVRAGFISQPILESWAERQPHITENQQKHLDTLLSAIKNGKIEAIFSNKVGGFIQSCRLETTENFLSGLTHRYGFNLIINEEAQAECDLYKQFANDLIFKVPQIQQAEFKSGLVLQRLFEAFVDHHIHTQKQSLKILPAKVAQDLALVQTEKEKMRLLCDYLADLTDRHAILAYKQLYDPDYGSFTDLS